MAILNLTQHPATAQQIEAGVVEPANKKEVQALLTFEQLPTKGELFHRAQAIAKIAQQEGATTAMIGGAPYLMSQLESALYRVGVGAVYAYSERRSIEEVNPETGEVRKVNSFVHLGFVEV